MLSSNSPSITFLATQILTDAGTYSIDVKKSQDSGTTWSTALQTTYLYVNPCVSASFSYAPTFTIMLDINVNSTRVSNSLPLWQDSVTNSVNNGTIICAQVMSFYISQAPSAGANSSFYQKLSRQATSSTMTSGTQTITAAPTHYSEIGYYQITLVGCIVDRPSYCHTTTFLIRVICSITGVKILQSSPVGILQPQTWVISSTTQLTYQLSVDLNSTCGYPVTYWSFVTTSLTKQSCASSYFDYDSYDGLFYSRTYSDYSCSGVYNVSVYSVEINNQNVWTYPINTVASPNSFQLTLVDPCESATVTAQSVGNFSLLVYAALNSYGTFNSFTYLGANSVSNTCGALSYSVTLALGTASNMITTFTVNQSARNFQAQSLNLNQIGTFTATLTGALASYPTRLATTTFTVTVLNPCWQTTLSGSAFNLMSCSVAQVASCIQQAGTINDGVSSAQSQTLTMCGGVTYYQISDTPNPPASQLLSTELALNSSGLVSIQTTNALTLGIHSISVGVKLTSYPNVTLTKTFTLTITACVVTSAKVVQLSNQGSLTTQIYYLSATVGLTYALSVIQTPACGYSVSGWAVTATGINGTQPANFQTIGQTTGVYQIAATLTQNQVGLYNIAITGLQIDGAQWSSALDLPSSFILDVVSDCATTIVTASSVANITLEVFEGSSTTSYNIFASFSDTVSTAATIPGLCAIHYTTSITNNAAGFSLTTFSYSSQQFNIYSDHMNQMGTYTVTLTGTVTQFPSQSATTSFIINITDPCLNSVIQGPTVQNFVVFVGQNQTSSTTYTYNDTVSFQRTQVGDVEDFCGPKFFQFEVNGIQSNQYFGNNTEQITYTAPQKSASVGTVGAILKVCLSNYLTVCKTINFNQTTLSFQTPVVQNQIYTIGQSELTIKFSPFVISPKTYAFSPPLVSTLTAYFTTVSTNISSLVDLQSPAFKKILNQNWIKLSENTQQFSIQTQDPLNVGNYTIVLIQTLDQFPNIKPFCQFNLTIQKPTPVVLIKALKPPFFDPALKTQVQNQCPDYQGTLWKFKLPQPSDPNNATVSISVVLSKTFFTFDPSSNTITQLKVPENPVNQTIKINLIDSLSQTAQINFVVQFICVQPPQLKLNNSQSDIKNQKEWPTAKINKIEGNGIVHIRFNQQMKVPDRPFDIENKTVSINGTDYPILQITIIPGQFSDPHMLKFKWKFVQFTTSELQIQLDFANPMYVSSRSQYPDKISVQIMGAQFFADQRANYMHPETTLNRFNLPQQTSSSAMDQAKALTKSTVNFMQSAMSSNVIVSIVISGPINQILGTIRSLQIISHLLLINLAFPATATDFYGGLMSIVTFQFYDFTNFYIKYLNLDSSGNTPFTNQFNLLGYNSLYIVLNFGLLCWTIFVTPVLYVCILIFAACCGSQFNHLKQKISRQMFYNNWIQLINETYIFLGLCVALNFYYFYWDNYGNVINSFCAVLFGSLIIMFPFFVIVYYNLPTTKLKIKNGDQEFLERYGAALDDLNFLRVGQLVLLYPFFSCLRKLCLIYVVVYMQDHTVFSIFFVIAQSIFMIVLIGYVPPFKNKIMNMMELVNEAFVLMITYHLFTFSDFVPDVPTRELVGKSLIAVTILSIVANFGQLTLTNLSLIARKLKLRYLKWQRDKQIQAAYKIRLEKALAANQRRKLEKEAQRQQELLQARQRRQQLQRHVKDDELDFESQNQRQRLQSRRQNITEQDRSYQQNSFNVPRFDQLGQQFSNVYQKNNRRNDHASFGQPNNQQSLQLYQDNQNFISRQTPQTHNFNYEWDLSLQQQNQLPTRSFADQPNYEYDAFQVQAQRLQMYVDNQFKLFDNSVASPNQYQHPIQYEGPTNFLNQQLQTVNQFGERQTRVTQGLVNQVPQRLNQPYHNNILDNFHQILQNNELIDANSHQRQEIRPVQTVSSQLKNMFESNWERTGIAKLYPTQTAQQFGPRDVKTLQQSNPVRRDTLENQPDSQIQELRQNAEVDRVLQQYSEERDRRIYMISSYRYLDQMTEFVDHGEYTPDMPKKFKYWLYNKIVTQRQRVQQERNWQLNNQNFDF